MATDTQEELDMTEVEEGPWIYSVGNWREYGPRYNDTVFEIGCLTLDEDAARKDFESNCERCHTGIYYTG